MLGTGKLARAGALSIILSGGIVLTGGAVALTPTLASASTCPSVPSRATWIGTWTSTMQRGVAGTVTVLLRVAKPNTTTGISKITGLATIAVTGGTSASGPLRGTLNCASETVGAILTGGETAGFSGTVGPSGVAAGGTYQDTFVFSVGQPPQVVDSGFWNNGVLPIARSISPHHGPAGTTVKINGKYLNQATSVTFNGVAAPILTTTPALTVSAPTGVSGTVPVQVTTPGGTSVVTPADYFTYGTVTR